VVVPSLPGHGFPAKPTTTGWDPVRTARAWVVLMGRLGYGGFVAQGGDWGAAVTQAMGTRRLRGCSGSTPTWPAPPPRARQGLGGRRPAAAGPRRRGANRLPAAAQLLRQAPGLRPAHVHAPPDAVRAGRLAGRPRGLHAGSRGWDRPARPGHPGPGGDPGGGLTRDDLLDNITLYWPTNTGVSAARLYWENTAGFFGAKAITVAFAISVFPDELYQAPAAGPSAPTRTTSSTTTGSAGAATSPPGSSRSCSPRSSGPPSGPCASRRGRRGRFARAARGFVGAHERTAHV
jgi:hypothetical protein